MTFPSFRWAQFFYSCICSYFLLSFEISLLASHFFLILPWDILCSLSRNRSQSRAFITTPLQPSISSLEIFKNKRCKAEWRAKIIRNKILHSFPSQTIQGTLLSSWGEKSFWLSLNLFFPAFLFFHHCCETFTPVSGLLSNKKDLQQYKALLNGQMKPVNKSILEKQNQRQPCDTGLFVDTSGNVRDSGYFLNALNGGVTNTPLNTRNSQGRKDV